MSDFGYNGPHFPPGAGQYHMYNFHHVGPYHHAAALPGNVITVDDSSDMERSPTRLQAQPTSNQAQSTPSLLSVQVKIINPDKKSEAKLFMLWNVDKENLGTLTDLRGMILEQFGEEAVGSELDFEMGFYRNNKRVWVRSAADFNDYIKKAIYSSDNITLWCMGVSEKRRRGKHGRDYSDSTSDCDSDDMHQRSRPKSKKKKTKHEEKLERVDELVDELKLKHGTTYTSIQYRVWAETIEARSHSSLDSPPTGSFFKRQGRKLNPSTSTSTTPGTSSALTPQKVAQLRSTYIQQIKELHDLQTCGAITNDHFVKQRDLLLEQMTKI